MAKKRKSATQIVVEDEASPEPKTPRLETTEEEMFRPGHSWYVIHTYSGYEDKVKTNLDQRVKSMDAEDLVYHVIVPSVEEIEIRDGQRRTVPRKIFPGYVLIHMITLQQEDPAASEADKALSSKAWTVVRNSPGVTGFVGSGTAPTPLERAEVQSIIRQMKAEEPIIKVGFGVGQSVRVVDGPVLRLRRHRGRHQPRKGQGESLRLDLWEGDARRA